MRLLFTLIGLLGFSLSATAAGEWLYYKNFPWVYDNVTEDWLYLRGTNDGKFYAYRNSTKEWEEFTAPETEKTWDEKYEEWVQNPEPYGGLSVLQQIKEAKDSGATQLSISWQNISDLTPLAGLTNLEVLSLYNNNISDLSPLAGLTNLRGLDLRENNISDMSPLAGMTNLMSVSLGDNPIPASQQAMLEEALPNTYITWHQDSAPPGPPDDDIPSTEEVSIRWIMWMQNPEPYGGLEVLQQIKDAKDSGATELNLMDNNISDISPLEGLTNLERLTLYDNNITDLTPLAGLTNLTGLGLSSNNISDISPLEGLTNLTGLNLMDNNISDLTPLAGLTNLTELYLDQNNISDLTPLVGLTNLTKLVLSENNIRASQKAMLREALPNTYISWPDVIIDDSEPAEKPSSTHTAQLNNGVSLEMIWVEPGTFTMGSPTSEVGRNAERETQHEVTLTQGFYLGKYEVTQAQYEAVMAGNYDWLSPTPSYFNGYPDRPVENVSWEDIQVFLTRLNAQQAGNIPEGWAYVLPTEAQWEYACRAGTTTAYSWGDSITSNDANYNWDGAHNTGADFKQTRDVGQYSANPWGFFDMHGNVYEWTADRYAAYSSGAQTDPEGPATGSYRVYRGGSWNATGTSLRSAFRFRGLLSYRDYYIGFRVGFQQQ